MNFRLISFVLTTLSLLFGITPKNDLSSGKKKGIVYESSDGGKTWMDVSDGLPEKFDPRPVFVTQNELLLGYEKGIIRKNVTADAKWQKEQYLNEPVSRIFHSKNGAFIYNFDAGFLQKIEITEFWVPVLNEFKGKAVFCFLEMHDGALLVGTNSGLFQSKDSGKSWLKVFEDRLVFTLAAKENVLIGGTEDGLIRSLDSGENWQNVLNEDGPIQSVKYLQGGFVAISQSIQLFSSQGKFPSASANTLRRSIDGGKTWSHLDENLAPLCQTKKVNFSQSPVRKISDVEQFENYILTSTDNGIYRSSDLGKSWEAVLPSFENSYFDIAKCGKVLFAVRIFDGC